ncbi:unnamed protein product [Zymoseptoria tritici ST99CH_1A5]|uniref:NTF2-like domain-containing protein n=4 Tax=Zymoseptoria tritici TaxID=1047171 RepID=F9XCS7_ZYMTI|nr:uncharacterized protein MYCGRDRAFT_81079 [Zymoseptoria tritici IPO323]SMQ51513.1 unnamed protein product [Zymoseptoria tritici ST99CH_3D7]SMR53588.1 unnamed protein product [Zymoseptoria tritici ST99CH_1E4]SMR55968.1 unnamed protein product [Zymoseptoria tritici ST99CH_3D1]SMY25155.1 unnamed protein product [Zymoseptoria tritici ST99CH_1A5]EGP86359.1 hypothetical protein MYCGRDRAFT_81079 [Zymoseptoria tritici IPO323]
MRFTTAVLASATLFSSAYASPAPTGYLPAPTGSVPAPPAYAPPPPSYAPAPPSYAPSPPAYTPSKNGPKPRKGFGRWGKKHQHSYNPKPQCLSDEDADQGADIFRQLIQEYSDELALEALTEDFIDYTSAVNIIRNRGNEGPIVVNGISFGSRQEFMDAQGSQPQIPFDTLQVFHGCDHIAMRWQTLRSANGQPNEANNIPVVGNAIMETVPDTNNSYGFRIKVLYSEFNSAAWLVNNGVFTPTPIAKRDVDHIGML